MNDLNRLYHDIVAAAQLAEAPYSKSVIKQTINTFKDGFARGAIQFRTTTKPSLQRRLDVRYEELNAPEPPLDVARRAGLLPDLGRDIDNLIPQLYRHYPYMGDGVDFDVSEGVTKVWYFTLGGVSLESAFTMSAMPASVASHIGYYDKFQLRVYSIIGVDYRSQTTNLYIRLDQPFHHTPAVLKEMVEDLGFEAPMEAINYSTQAISVALTYSWDSPRIERLCFYVPHGSRDTTPKGTHPLIDRWVEEAPLLQKPIYVISWTFGPKGTYVKMENDYTGNTIDVIGRTLSDDPAPTA